MHIKIHVKTSSKKEKWEELAPNTYFVEIKEPAKEGRANAKIIAMIHKHLKPPKAVKIVSGHTSHNKIIEI